MLTNVKAAPPPTSLIPRSYRSGYTSSEQQLTQRSVGSSIGSSRSGEKSTVFTTPGTFEDFEIGVLVMPKMNIEVVRDCFNGKACSYRETMAAFNDSKVCVWGGVVRCVRRMCVWVFVWVCLCV